MLHTLPPELLSLVALHLATSPGSSFVPAIPSLSLGPPAALIPLLLACRYVHTALTASPALFAGICKAKFGWAAAGREAALYPYPSSLRASHTSSAAAHGKSRLIHLCGVLRVLREGDVHGDEADWALTEAWAMLVGDEWVDCEVPNPDATARRRAWLPVPKNRAQLEWAGAEAFAERYLRERVYGRERWWFASSAGERFFSLAFF
jgi:hypothetical protein